MAWSGPLSLAPNFVNNDHVTSEFIYSTARARQEVLAWPRATVFL